NLFRRPALRQPQFDLYSQPGHKRQLARLRPASSLDRRLIRLGSSISLATPVPTDLPRDCRGRPAPAPRQRPTGLADRQAARQLLTFSYCQLAPSTLGCPRRHTASRRHMVTYRTPATAHVSGNHPDRLTLSSPRPDLRPLGRRQHRTSAHPAPPELEDPSGPHLIEVVH